MPPPFDIHTHVARHGTALRVLALELVGDGETADDAVQETWLGAVQSPPRHDAAIGGWLATLLRNVVRGFRRRERRRVRREQIVAAARGDVGPDHVEALVHGDVVRELIAAVEALEPPYRDAIWQRYFEGRAPREIAAATDTSVETVKSRIKRALGTLRERLGKRDGADWRGALVTAFGLRETTATAVMTGGLLMATWTKVAAAAAVVAIAAVFWWPAEPQPVRVKQTRANEVPQPSSASEATRDAERAASAAPALERSEVGAIAPPPDPKLATIRGRCVDERGEPIAGIMFRIWARVDEVKAEQWRLDHGEKPAWRDVSMTTAADGVFSLFFEPSPVCRYYSCELLADEFVSMSCRWEVIAAGSHFDAGDVTMRTGARLQGRVVDAQGHGVAGATLELRAPGESSLLQPPRPRERFIDMRGYAGKTDRDGRFVFMTHPKDPSLAMPLTAGTFDVSASSDVGKTAPLRAELRAGATSEVELSWQAYPQDSLITIRVVDETGQPVPLASITATLPRNMPLWSSGRGGACTLRRFETLPANGPTLLVTKFGFEPLRMTEPIPWGARDVELRLQRGAPVEVSVVDAHGQPIREFTVRVIRAGASENGYISSADADIRARGPFADGVARVDAVATGKWNVLLEFPTATGLQPCIRTLDVVSGAPQRLRVQVLPAVERLLRVVSTSGVPFAGTKVQLCDALYGEMKGGTMIFGASQALVNRHGAILVQEGTTNARGELLLRGPADRVLTVLILGPGHPVVRKPDVLFAAGGEIVIEVDGGGRIEGRIEPVDVIADLRRRAAIGTWGAAPPRHPVTVALVSADGRVRLPDAGAVEASPGANAVDDAGRFALTGVPAGSWRVELQYRMPGPLGFSTSVVPLGAVDVRANETASFVGDASALLAGTLRGRVVANGAPLANAPIVVDATHGNDPLSRFAPTQHSLNTDAEGRFELRDRGGSYRVRTATNIGGKLPWYAVETATVAVGQTTEQTFSLFSGKLELKVLDAGGKPVSGVTVRPFVDTAFTACGELVTQADGTCTADFPAGTHHLRVLPKAYQSHEAISALYAQPGGIDRAKALLIDLGTATVVAGQTTALELRLPAEFDK